MLNNLLANQKLLTHAAMGHWDNLSVASGKLGAIFDSGSSFITTPNANFIVEPPFGVQLV